MVPSLTPALGQLDVALRDLATAKDQQAFLRDRRATVALTIVARAPCGTMISLPLAGAQAAAALDLLPEAAEAATAAKAVEVRALLRQLDAAVDERP